MVLIDTSSWVEALREAGNSASKESVGRLLSRGEGVWCDLVRVELWNGARGQEEKKRLREFDDELPRLAIDNQVWDVAVQIAVSARSAGLTFPAADFVIFG